MTKVLTPRYPAFPMRHYFVRGTQHREACVANRLSRAEKLISRRFSAANSTYDYDGQPHHPSCQPTPKLREWPRIPLPMGSRSTLCEVQYVGCEIKDCGIRGYRRLIVGGWVGGWVERSIVRGSIVIGVSILAERFPHL